MSQFMSFELGYRERILSRVNAANVLKLIRDDGIDNVNRLEDVLLSGLPGYLRSTLWPRVWEIVGGLQSAGLIEASDSPEGLHLHNLRLTPLFDTVVRAMGLSLTALSNVHSGSLLTSPLFGTPAPSSKPLDIFVLMPFADTFRHVYEEYIVPTAQELGLSVVRGDSLLSKQSVVFDLWCAINSCELLVADCTGQNANVFYEIGIAHTVGKPVVLISQNREDIPFDLRHMRSIVYRDDEKGLAALRGDLRGAIESLIGDACRSALERRSPSDDGPT